MLQAFNVGSRWQVKAHYRKTFEIHPKITAFKIHIIYSGAILNVLGQKLIENKVDSNGEGYLYEFDMSYAATGVYLLRIGTRKVGIVKRFIVK